MSRKAFLLIIISLAGACGTNQETTDDEQPIANTSSTIKYDPTYESLAEHPLPEWFQDSKLGIFIHWGLYSVPGWAKGTTIPLEEIVATNNPQMWFENNPYAEWYYNSLRIDNSSTKDYHLATYGPDYSYFDFAEQFNSEIKKWDPEEWAQTFKDAGAGYVVLTTKHHDGFLLWPSNTPNPHREGYYASRDLVGELSEAVNEEGMKMGLYYSSGLDWTFNDQPIVDFASLFAAVPQEPEYANYVDTHWRELIERYEPSILWADIGSPRSFDEKKLIADYYNEYPTGVVNNRHKFLLPGMEDSVDVWYDFLTPEYQVLDSISPKKWETCRGIGLSFGYNQLEDASTFLSVDDLVDSFIDIVSKNGNLLLNIGPKADGTIPQGQLERLQGLGDWMKINGEAIKGTRAAQQAEAETMDGGRIRFTSKGDILYIHLLDEPNGDQIKIQDFSIDPESKVTMLGTSGSLNYNNDTDGLKLELPANRKSSAAYVLKVE